MCGIVGVVGRGQDDRIISRMLDALRHRGPDGQGIARYGRIHVGASRLAFVDIAGGVQPAISEDRRISLVFNGEIYNHMELRESLQRRGHIFRSRSDTEVLLRLYVEHGEACVTLLRGMFAFAIVEGNNLFLARDRFGIKPLHYAEQQGPAAIFLFASEIKALLRHPDITPNLNQQTLADWIALSQPAGAATFIQGVKMLPPGHTLRVNCEDGIVLTGPTRYAAPAPERREQVPIDEAERLLEHHLQQAVHSHMMADVEIGVCLSGGLDSTLLALMANDIRPGALKTFTVNPAIAGHSHPDGTSAAYVARKIGSSHVQVDFTFENFLDALPSAVLATEGPGLLAGVPFLLLNRRIGPVVKGCLCGEGADELFGGYEEYVNPLYMLTRLRTGLATLSGAGLAPSEAATAMEETLSRALEAGSSSYLDAILRVNMQSQLERHHLESIDKYAMASSVEIRVPFLDDAVVEFVQKLPVQYLVNNELNIQKHLLKRLLVRRYGMNYLDIAMREKRGLPSAADGFAAPFERLCQDLVAASYHERHEFGRCFARTGDLVLFDLFAEIYLQHRGDAGCVGSMIEFIASRGR
jgi:asparagine synthase (glutamine-hydrolysing)